MRNIIRLALVAILLYGVIKQSHAQNTVQLKQVWKKHLNGNTGDEALNDMAVHPDGTVLIGGRYTASNTVDVGGLSLPSASASDGFLVQYTKDGTPNWASRYHYNNNESYFGVAFGTNKKPFAVGGANTGFSGFSFANLVISSADATSGVLSHNLSTNGNNVNNFFCVASDEIGKIYAGGWFSSTNFFNVNQNTTPTINVLGNNTQQAIIAKHNDDRTLRWAYVFGSTGADVVKKIIVADGFIYAVGTFQGTVDFDNGGGTFNLVAPTGVDNGFVLKIDTAGVFVNAWSLSSASASGVTDVGINKAGHLFISAYINGPTDVNLGGGSNTINSAGGEDALLIKMDTSNGNLIWHRQFGSTGSDRIHRLALNKNADVYIGGYYSSATLNLGYPNSNIVTNSTSALTTNDAFLAGYDSSGNSLCAYSYGSSGAHDNILALGFDTSQSLYVAGYFQGVIQTEFAPGYSSISTAVGAYDGFVIKYNTVCPYLGKSLPVDPVACSGKTIGIAADVFGESLTYQWKFNGTNIANGTKYAGVNTDSLTISNFQNTDSGYYHLSLSRNGCATLDTDSVKAKLNDGIVPTNPVLYYRFDGNLLEESGAAAATIALTNYSADRFGSGAKVFSQANTNYYLDVPNVSGVYYSASMWVYHSSSVAQTLIWGGTIVRELQISGSKLGMYNGSSFIDFGYSLASSSWYHIGYVKNGSKCVVYVNGIKVYENATLLPVGSASIIALIGSTSNDGLLGRIDDLRIYNVALTDENMHSLFLMPQQLSGDKQMARCEGSSFVIQTKISGAQSYQWYKNGAALSNGALYAGVTTDSLIITNAQAADGGNYVLSAANNCVIFNSDTTKLYVGNLALSQNLMANFLLNGTLADVTGNITATGTVNFTTATRLGSGQCANMLGASGRTPISFPSIANDTLSVSMWFKGYNAAGARTLLCGNTGNARHLAINSAQKLGYINAAGTFVPSTQTITHSIWYHIVVTKVGNNQKIYVNGTLVLNDNGSFLNTLAANAFTRIGGVSATLEPAYGDIDDVRIYNRELNELEIVGLLKTFDVKTNPVSVSACGSIDNVSLLANFENTDTTQYTLQWKKDGMPIANGAKYTGANAQILWVTAVTAADTGNYLLEAIPNGLVCLPSQTTEAKISFTIPNSLTDSLRWHLRFSNSTIDASSYKRIPNATTGITYTADKQSATNAAGVFNGLNSQVTAVNVLSNTLRSYTVMAWFKVNQATGGIISSANQLPGATPSEHHSLLFIGTDNKLHGKFYNGNATTMASAVDVNDNQWHHAALVATPINQYLYLDGVQVGTQPTTTASIPSSYITVGTLYGQWPNTVAGWNNFLQGNIDEVKLYNKALSANEIGRVVQNIGFTFSSNQTIGFCNATPAVIESQAQGAGVVYQWHKNGVAILNSGNVTGTDSTALSFASIGASDTGNYQCVISKNCYKVWSDTIKVSVHTTITVVANPQSGNVCPANTLVLGVKANGAALQYQWKKAGVNLIDVGRVSGATSDTLRITGATTADAGSYTVDMADACANTAISTTALVTVNTFAYSGASSTKVIYPLNGNGNASVPALNGSTISTSSAMNRFSSNGSALNFTRTSGSRVVLPINMFATGNPAFTVSVWFTTTTTNTTMGLIGTASGNPTANPTTGWSPVLFVNNTGKLTGKFYDINGTAAQSTATVTDGTWHQALITGNGTSQSLYLDGVLVGTNTGTYSTTAVPYTIIGASYSASNGWAGHTNGWQYFNGILDDARFYTSYFTASDVLTQFTKAEIAVQPAATNLVCVGAASPAIRVTANGSNLTYQWYKNGVALSNSVNVTGATTSSINIATMQPADTGYYYARVINGCNYITSDSSRVVLNVVPEILISPTDQSSCVGGSALLSVSAAGTGLTYQWQKNGVNLTNGGNISGATASALTISSLSNSDTMNYRCIVTNTCGVDTSATAQITLGATLQILQQPISQSICANTSAILFVKSTDPLATYTWKRDGTTLSGWNKDTIVFGAFNGVNVGNYQVIVNSACGVDTSDMATLLILDETQILLQPNAFTSICGTNPIVMSVTAIGVNLTYKWQKGGVDIPNATSATYTNLNPLPTDTGNYRVLVSGDCGAVITSTVSRVNIYQPLSITMQPISSLTICSGNSSYVNLTVTATGSIVGYQWLRNGSPISNQVNVTGATSRNLQFLNSTLGAGSYSCRIYGNCDTVTSTATVFGYTPYPTITTQPLSKTICEGGNVSFKVSATNAMGYEWIIGGSRLNDIPNKIQGAFTDSITAINVRPSDIGGMSANIYAVVSNGCPSQAVASNFATLTFTNGISITQQSDTLISVCENQPAMIYINSSTDATYVWKRNGVTIPNQTNDTLFFSLVTSADNASFTCEATSTCGNVSSLAIRLNVLPLTVPLITQNGNVLSTTSFLGYEWHKNGEAIANATQQTFNPTESGIYSVRVVNVSGCIVFSAEFNFAFTGINDVFANGKSVKVYPNPTQALLTIETNGVSLSSTIEVFDITSKRVASMLMDNGKLDVSLLPAGMYILKLTTEDKQTGFVKFNKQ